MDDSCDMVEASRQHRALLRARVVRAVHAVPRGLPLAGEDPPAHRRTGTARRPTSTSWRASSRTSRAARSAPWPTRPSGRCARSSRSSAGSSSRRWPAPPRPAVAAAPAGRPTMPTITIDGRMLEFAPGQTIIQVAQAAGIEIPHYCYHPGLSVAGNCRICLVEVEKDPRSRRSPATSQATDGHGRHTQSAARHGGAHGDDGDAPRQPPARLPDLRPGGRVQAAGLRLRVRRARDAHAPSRRRTTPKNVPFGAKIVYDGERCIKCTRCVRFTDEVTATARALAWAARGDHEMVIMTSKGEFATPYAMNIIDLCPVGALTSKDFRFESRVWFMDFTESICTGCARGCNVTDGRPRRPLPPDDAPREPGREPLVDVRRGAARLPARELADAPPRAPRASRADAVARGDLGRGDLRRGRRAPDRRQGRRPRRRRRDARGAPPPRAGDRAPARASCASRRGSAPTRTASSS